MKNTDQHLPLTPIIHSWINNLAQDKRALFEAIETFNSPLNIHHLKPFQENIKEYSDILQSYNVKHKIFFARKANKCIAFPKESENNGHGVDTASFRELKQCLDAGLQSENIILTAAVKNQQLLELAVENDITIVLDNTDEWDLLKKVITKKDKKVNVNIRLGGFLYEGKTLPTRFGFLLEDAYQFIIHLHQNEKLVNFTGLHFHLNGYSVSQRVAAIEQSIQLIDRLQKEDIKTLSLDIGGGILMNYLKDKDQWNNFNEELKKAILEKRSEITYQNDSLGIIKINDELYGSPTVYPYYNALHKGKLLEEILTSQSTIYQKPIYELLNERMIEFRMEPGRSLLDQCGVTIAKIAFRKKDTAGNWLFGLEMNRTQLRSSSADFLLDPIHLPKETSKDEEKTYGYLVGAYCLEQELILKRKIEFNQFPQVGDLIIFPNTAGYMMHFFESEAHLFELANNVIYHENRFTLDKI